MSLNIYENVATMVKEDSNIPFFTRFTEAKILEYCKKHAGTGSGEEDEAKGKELEKWDMQFVNDMKVAENGSLDSLMGLCHILLAADYLKIKGLVDLTCRVVADLTNWDEKEITPEVLEGVREEILWAFDKSQ